MASVFHVIAFRFAGATLLHALTSAAVGYHWAMGIKKGHPARSVLVGIVAATTLHTIFNYLILNYGEQGVAVVFLLGVGLYILMDFEKLKRNSPHSPLAT